MPTELGQLGRRVSDLGSQRGRTSGVRAREGGRIWRPQNEHPGTSVITSFGHRHHCRVLWVCSQARLLKERLIPAPPKS